MATRVSSSALQHPPLWPRRTSTEHPVSSEVTPSTSMGYNKCAWAMPCVFESGTLGVFCGLHEVFACVCVCVCVCVHFVREVALNVFLGASKGSVYDAG